ncbi:MAG: efflux RND transporter permease subunit [Moraxellaceae bacterium]|nr:efflux RND transporter permease subunit [Moraxellaceae bacterium]
MGISGRITKAFLTSQLTPLLAIIAFLLGLFAISVTPREEEPQINVTMANVMIPFVGASSHDVETLVATPAEQVLSQIQGIEHIYSVSRPNMAILTVQFKVGVERSEAIVRLYDALNSHKDWLNSELGVGEPIVKPKGIDDVPIMSLTLWTKDNQRAAYDLGQVAHSAEIELKRVAGTRDVKTIGATARVLRVDLDNERLKANGLSALEVAGALKRSNIALAAGDTVQNNQIIHIETNDFLRSQDDVANLVVGVYQENPVYLSNIATISDGADIPKNYVWLGTGAAAKTKGFTTSGEFPAVTIAISKKSGENAVDVSERLIQRVEELKNTVIPSGIEVSVTRDYGETANDKAQKLIQKLIFATFSVVVLVFFTLGKREALIVGTAVLLTLAATLFASWAWGFTLNRVSLFALIFSIGILVDDAIVVVENIHRRMLLDNKPLLEVIPLAVDEVGSPTILATFTVIAALLPMAFVSGLMGPYMSPIPINASMGMVISLLIAFIITPWLALKLLKSEPSNHTHDTNSRLMAVFRRIMSPFLQLETGRKRRHQLYAGIVALIVLSVSLGVVKWVVLKMLPFDNKSEFQVIVDLPAGTPVEKTAAALHDMGAYLATVNEVTDYQAYAGTAAPINFNGLVRQYYLRADAEQGDLQVNLVDKHQRSRKSHDIANDVRPTLEKIAKVHGANVKVVEVPPGPPVMSPLVAEIYGADETGRANIAKSVRQVFEKNADIVAIDDSLRATAPQNRLLIDQNKAMTLGVTPQAIAETLNLGLSGVDSSMLMAQGAKYGVPIRLTLPDNQKSNLDELLKLTVKSNDGSLINLSDVVQVKAEHIDPILYHKDLLPVTYVVADMAGQLDSPLYGLFAMREAIQQLKIPHGATLQEYFINQPSDPYRQYALKWDGESQITYETFRDMGIAYGVGLVLIYLLVVAQFRSYSIPAIIMMPIPLTIIGVMPGHALLGAQFTATSMIGMIALAGIIVRNSILLVDFINLRLASGELLSEAVIQAAATRAKPITLTGLAAMLGAFFILDDPIFNGLAISLIFGILVSTLLTLVLIPVLYYALKRRQA